MSPSPSFSVNYTQLSAGKFDHAKGSDAAALKKTFSDIAATKANNLVIHFHGGLVSRESALRSAEQLSPLYKAAGAESFFVIWETSAREIIGQNVQRIVEEPIFQSILVRATEFVKGKLEKSRGLEGSKSIGGLPQTFASDINDELDKGKEGHAMFEDLDVDHLSPDLALTDAEQQYIEDQVNKDDDIRRHVQAIAAPKAADGSKGAFALKAESTLMDADVVNEIAPAELAGATETPKSIFGTIAIGKRVVTVVAAVIWRYAKGRDHGLYLTVVEEIMRAFYVRAAGRFLWTEMKDAVGKAFLNDPDCGGNALVEQLAALWGQNRPCVTLVGHSAGAIYVSRLLKQLDQAMPPDFQANVVLIAPACTFDYLADALSTAGKRVANLRIFGMSDAVERNDRLVPGVYPASLLYFVSGVLEDERDQPLVGMQRYYSKYEGAKFESIAEVKRFPCLAKQHAYAWAQAGGFDGANCDMIRHGGWAEAEATRESVLFLIRKGCGHVW